MPVAAPAAVRVAGWADEPLGRLANWLGDDGEIEGVGVSVGVGVGVGVGVSVGVGEGEGEGGWTC